MKTTIITLAIVAAFLAGFGSVRIGTLAFQNPSGDTGFIGYNSEGATIAVVQENGVLPQAEFGDINEEYNGVTVAASCLTNAVYLKAPSGFVRVFSPQMVLRGSIVMQSPNGHWWEYMPNNLGELVGTDLGATEP